MPDPIQLQMRWTVGEVPGCDGFGGAVIHVIRALEVTRLPLLGRSRRNSVQLQCSEFPLSVQCTFDPVQRCRVIEERVHFVFAAVEQLHRYSGFLRQIGHLEQPVFGLSRTETAAGDQLMDGDAGLVDPTHGLRRFQRRGRHLHAAPIGDCLVFHLCRDADRFQRILHFVGHGVIGFEQLRCACPLPGDIALSHGNDGLRLRIADGFGLGAEQLVAVESGQRRIAPLDVQ